MLQKFICTIFTIFVLITMLQASAVDQNIESSGGLMDSFLSSISELLPAGQTTNDYVNTILKIMQEGRLPCTVHSVVPWELTCTQDE